MQFIRSNEKYGRNDLKQIAKEIEGKTYDEVVEYSLVFWKRYHELQDADRYIAQIERGEAKVKRQETMKEILNKKVKY